MDTSRRSASSLAGTPRATGAASRWTAAGRISRSLFCWKNLTLDVMFSCHHVIDLDSQSQTGAVNRDSHNRPEADVHPGACPDRIDHREGPAGTAQRTDTVR